MGKWLFFDLGSTLVNEENAHKQRIIDTVNINEDITFDDLYAEMVKASAEYKQPYPTAVNNLKLTNKSKYPKEFEMLYTDTHFVLKELHTKYKIGIIANQSAGSEDRLKKWGLIDYIDYVCASAETGLAKPDISIFNYALNQTGALPSQSIMIGDRLDNDIFPAKQVGMKTIWIKQGFGAFQSVKSPDYQPDYTISELSELINLLL